MVCCYILYLMLVHAGQIAEWHVDLQAEAAKSAERAPKNGAGCSVITHVRSAVETGPDAPPCALEPSSTEL